MEVYSPELELLGILGVFRSVMWEERAFSAGSFSIESILTKESVSLLVPENIVWISDDTAGIIEHITARAGEDGPMLTVKGRLLSGLLDRRILWGLYDLSGEAPELMYSLVDDCAINPKRGDIQSRVIPGLALDGEPPKMPGEPATSAIRKQKTGGSLLSALEELGSTSRVSFGVRFDPESLQMVFWARPGADRTVKQESLDPVFFSTELDDVLSSEYYYDSSDYRTVALVSGEGEGEGRVTETAFQDGGAGASGLVRRELYVDARDLQSGDVSQDKTITDDEYREILRNRGMEKLSESQLVRSFSAKVRNYGATYEYGSDFFLGDKITVTDERLGVSIDAVVEAATRSVSEQGEGLELTLGYSQPTLFDLLKRKAVG